MITVVVVHNMSGKIISVLQFDRMPDKGDLIFDRKAKKYYKVISRVYNIPEYPKQHVTDGVLYCAECPIIRNPSPND